MKCQGQNLSQEKRVAHDSHVNIPFLTNGETEQRLRNIQQEKRVLIVKKKNLQQKLQKLIKKDGDILNASESEENSSLVKETSTHVQTFPENSFQSILWEEQLKHNALKDKQQMKWHPLVIRFALSPSLAAYKQVPKLGFLLCHQRGHFVTTLSLVSYNQWCPAALHSADEESSERGVY